MPTANLTGPSNVSRLHHRDPETGERIAGPHERLSLSNAPRLSGDCSNIYGVASGIGGRVTAELRGEVTGLRGVVTGITGDLDACDLTPEDRAAGVDIQDLQTRGQ